MTFLNTIELVIGNQIFVLITILISFLLKLLIVFFTMNQQVKTHLAQRLRFLLLAILGANMLSDIAWILVLLKNMSIFAIDQRIVMFIGRISWGFAGIQYQGLALFLEGLITRQSRLSKRQQLCCAVTILFMLFPIGAAFIWFNHPEPPLLIFIMNRIAMTYYMLFLLPLTLFIVLRKFRSEPFPYILVKQLRLIIYGLIVPHLVSDIIQVFPFRLDLETNNYLITGLSTLFLTAGLLYCSWKIMGLRFLNLRDQVYGAPKANFVTSFKTILDQLGQVVSTHELKFVTQNFFKEALGISAEKTTLYLRPVVEPYQPEGQFFNTDSRVEHFLAVSDFATKKLMKKMQVIIYDEISFSHFYEQTPQHEELLRFLDTIQADVFLPIYNKNRLIAYIIVNRHARGKELYNSAERDEVVMFVGYLHHTINVLYNQSAETLMRTIIQLTREKEQLEEKFSQEKEELKKGFRKEKEVLEREFAQENEAVQKELYAKHQEMNQYKECFQPFLFNSQRSIGLIFYKNNRFTFGNQEAKNFIPININTNIGHPLVQKLQRMTQQVAQFRSPQTVVTKNEQGETITLAAIPHLEQNNVVIIISHADIPDLIKQKINLLKDPNRWDYLLYLETTESGRLINQLMPGNGKELLDFKIELLETALGKKATLLDMAEEDLLPTVELLHRLSLREELYTLNLQGMLDTVRMATKLFGINTLFGAKKDGPPLLELLDQRGTLFIKDIHLLDIACQDYLAEFIRCGFYRVYKSEKHKRSNVRIICSSNQDIERLIKENKFSPALFLELNPTTLKMPLLSSLSTEELDSLADGFSQQAVSNNTFNNLLALTEKDKHKLAKTHPTSLQELKKRTNQLILQKAEQKNINQEIIDPIHETNDPILLQAARLGKYALKDKKIMTLLWQKFDKNQNKIAEFLGVNRSSVHRRCRLYSLT